MRIKSTGRSEKISGDRMDELKQHRPEANVNGKRIWDHHLMIIADAAAVTAAG